MKSFFSKFYYKLLGDLGFYMQISGNGIKAKELCEKSVLNGGDSVKALNIFGIICLQEGNAKDALTYLTRARELNKNPVMEKRLVVSIGSCYWLLGEIDNGIQIIEAIIGKYDYLSPDLYTTLGYLHLLNDDYEKALNYTNEAINSSEDHAPAYDNMGQIHFKQGDFNAAEKYFLKALELNSGMTDSKFFLGLINERRGAEAEAKKYFKLAHGDYVNALNTVKKEEIEAKYNSYFA